MMKNSDYKIAFLSAGLGHVNRGVEWSTRNLALAMKEKDFNVSLYQGGGKPVADVSKVIGCLKRTDGLSLWLQRNKILNKYFWRLSNALYMEQLTFSINLLIELLFQNFDVIYTKEPTVALFCHQLKKLRLIRSRVIFGNGMEEPYDFLNCLDYIHHLTPFYQKEAEKNGVESKKSFGIGNYIDLEFFKQVNGSKKELRQKYNIPEDAVIILSVAAIKDTHKRMKYLIQEFANAKLDHAYLLLVGGQDPETKDVIEFGKKCLGERLIYRVDFPFSDINQMYQLADLFVLCSLKEMFGTVVIEAMACSLPVVVHQHPPFEWIVGENGYFVDMSKQGNLTEFLNNHVNDKNKLNVKAEKAREHVYENFSKEAIGNSFEKMICEVINDNK